ncbi:hypothetical protein B0H10DRAFT_1805120, partial [Mycena sp. CBHHK59/15]
RDVPWVFGVFACHKFTGLVMQHLGHPVATICELSLPQRWALYNDLTALHECGIVHADVRADNIVVSESGRPSLIDFSHARTHRCPGPLVCEELRQSLSIFLLQT